MVDHTPHKRRPTTRLECTQRAEEARKAVDGGCNFLLKKKNLLKEHLSYGVGAADGLLDAATCLFRQQGLGEAHYLHAQLTARDHHKGLQAACLVPASRLRQPQVLLLRPLYRASQHRQQVRKSLDSRTTKPLSTATDP